MEAVTGADLARYLTQHDAIEAAGATLLDRGANPARIVADLYACIVRLQCEGRFTSVDVARIEDVMGDICAAQTADAGR